MLKIVGIKTNKGYYIASANNIESNYLWSKPDISKLYFNGKQPKLTFDKMWWYVPDEITSVEQMVSQAPINKRYELKDKELCSERIPMVIAYDNAVREVDEDGYYVWYDAYKNYSSLYEFKQDEQPDALMAIDFDFEVIVELQIDEIDAPLAMNYNVQRTQWAHEGTRVFSTSEIKHQIIDRIISPSILLHNKPCFLTSEQVYEILRQYIKENINPKVAHITSDYDFCFTVKKVVALSNPIERQQEILNGRGRSYKHPKYKRWHVVSREVECFEMTYSPKNYDRYTPIPGMEAKDEYELKEKLDKLCENTISMINEPLVDCPHCEGYGVILKN